MNNQDVSSALFSNVISGSWWGPASEHWDGIADEMERVGENSGLVGLRKWTTDAVNTLRNMAERERASEDEESVRSR